MASREEGIRRVRVPSPAETQRKLLAAAALAILALLVTGGTSPTGFSPPHQSGDRSTTVAGDCSSETALCLGEGRFVVEVTWTTPDGASGSAHPVSITSDSGYFWFFDPDNAELIVKVLNGCSVNDHYWFFSGGLTNVQVTITVTDSATGETKTYTNPQDTPFAPIIDTAAFGNCTESASLAAHPEEPQPGRSLAVPVAHPAASRRGVAEGCVPGDTVLCLHGRFQVEATWQTASGASGPAHVVPIGSGSGYFWFFEPSNVELMVKALNACDIEQGNWFFAAGMTDVGVQLQITDTFTGEVRNYGSPLGVAFLPIQDTGAFAFCPTPTFTPSPTPSFTPTPTPEILFFTPRPTLVPATSVAVASGSGQICFKPHPCLGFTIYSFSPRTVQIHVGETVTWSWSGAIGHSTTSGTSGHPSSIWDSGVRLGATVFSHTFTEAGTFPYYCAGAGHFHVAGSVVVIP